VALMSQSYFGLLPLVVGLWKCGFPETLSYFRLAFKRSTMSWARASAFMNGAGVAIHHLATSFFIVTIITGKQLLDRDVVSTTFPLLVQHMFCLLKYINIKAYTIVELVLEGFWEWEVIWHLLCVDHPWNLQVTGWTMLCAHWLFLLAAAVDICISNLQNNGVKHVGNLGHEGTITWIITEQLLVGPHPSTCKPTDVEEATNLDTMHM